LAKKTKKSIQRRLSRAPCRIKLRKKERKRTPGATVKGDAFEDGPDIEEDGKSNADKVTWVLIVIIGLVAAFALFVGLDGFGHNTKCGGGKGGFHCSHERIAKQNKPPNTPRKKYAPPPTVAKLLASLATASAHFAK
jgi:hypothetical protein